MTLMAIPQFERFFRETAGLDVDKDDLKRYSDFVFEKIYDFLIIGEANAKANGRDVIEFRDLPITKGLQERIHEFAKVDEELELAPVLDHFVARPQLDATISEDAERRLASVAGGLSIALGRSFKIIDTRLKNPATVHWERAFQLFNLLL
jgi:hypothetical protein